MYRKVYIIHSGPVWWSQIPLNAYPRMHANPAVICSDVALMTYITPGPNFVKTLAMHFYFKFANNNHIGIFYVLLTETKLVTMDNPGLLPLQGHIRQSHAESGTTTPV